MKKRTGGVLEITGGVTVGEVQAVDTENVALWTRMKILPLPAWVTVSDQLDVLTFMMLVVLLLKWVEGWKSINSDLTSFKTSRQKVEEEGKAEKEESLRAQTDSGRYVHSL